MKLTYKDFCDPADVAGTLRVQRKRMALATLARETLVSYCAGSSLPNTKKEKQFLNDGQGRRWRVRLNDQSDNTTEKAAHRAMGVYLEVNALDTESLTNFFVITRGCSTIGGTRFAHSYLNTLKGLASTL